MICLVLSETTIEENIKLLEQNRAYIDLAELRVDYLKENQYENIIPFSNNANIPLILTCRRTSDGGKFNKSEKERADILSKALEGSFTYIDLEDDFKKSSLENLAKSKGVQIIRSYHDFEKVPSDIFHRINKIAKEGEIPKIAAMVTSVSDLITLFKVKEELKGVDKKIVVGMGDFGFPTRILYKKIGSMLTFVSSNEVAPGHISAKEMKILYKADKVDDNTRIYGIIGNPAIHSFSPKIHNPGFQQIKFNAIYVPFTVDSVRQFFSLATYLKIGGFSVTVPHKQTVLPYLGKITREVAQIGSCNTVIRVQNFWSGTNTDYYGFIQPLIDDLDSKKIQSALVVGAGGAARAVVWALRNHGCKVTIVNRTVDKAKQLASETMSSYDTLENSYKYESCDLVVQTTSVGMLSDEDPIENFTFNNKHTAYELIYRPKYTAMLQRAKDSGAKLIFGSEMLIQQGVLQFESFSGYHYPKRLDINLDLEEN
jgi:3-dehydroquinate dehydratase/shikimate dehydrogenase